MNGALTRTSSRFAIAAAAGLFMGGIALTPANAADLGGDCCADLEERVAELEATTVRKGNRKVSVKLSGQVNTVLMIWDDGYNTDAYIGDNSESSTRFRFTGSAKFKPGWSAGFLIEIEVESGKSSAFSQKLDNGSNENADGQLEGRKMAWFIKSDRLGTFWMGRYSPATDDITLLNIAGTPNVSGQFFSGTGFFNRLSGSSGAGGLINLTLGQVMPQGDTRRGHVVRYDTPSLAGFVFSASWGEDDVADVAVRYKKEWNSIRVVGGIGYHLDTDENESAATSVSNGAGMVGCGAGLTALNGFTAANGPCRTGRFDRERIAGSISIMHTPTGLYAYFAAHQDEENGTFAPTTHTGAVTRPTETHWYLQLGIKRRMLFRELGATTIYGEYQESDDGAVGRSIANLGANGGPTAEIVDSNMTSWGAGIVQDIDKAAMQLWLSFRSFDPSISVVTAPGGPVQGVPLEDQYQVQFGGKIKF